MILVVEFATYCELSKSVVHLQNLLKKPLLKKMVVARTKKIVRTNKKGQQQDNNNNDNNNNNQQRNNNDSSEIQSRSDLPVLPTRMEVRRARINEKKSKKEVRKQQERSEGGNMKSVVVDANSVSASNPFSAGSLLASAREGGKNKKKLMRDKTGRQGGVRGAPSLRSRTETTQNLTDKQREKIFVSEIQNIQKVQEHPAFQADPLGSLQLHLQGTARLLQAPNAECRRPPQQKKPQQQGHIGGGQQRFNNNFGRR